MRVVLDTGVLVRANAKSRGPARELLVAILDGPHELVISLYRKKDGTLAPLMPVLDTLVTLAPAQRSIREAVDLVCAQVAAIRGIPIAEGTILTNLYHQVELTYAEHEPARVVLSRILKGTNAERVSDGAPPLRITWRLLYDANEKSYFLNTYAIQR